MTPSVSFRRRMLMLAMVACVSFGLPPMSRAGSYSEEMSKVVKKAFGKTILSNPDQQRALVWLTYPTNNFGVGTTSILSSRGQDPRAAAFACSPSACFGRPTATSTAVLDVYGYASYGTGPPVAITEKAQRDIAIGALLNGIAGYLGISADVSRAKTTTYKLSIGKAYVRQLEKTRFAVFLRDSLDGRDARKIAFDEGRLVVFDADVLVDGFLFEMSIDSRAHGGLVARLDSLSKIGAVGDSVLKLAISSTTAGTYRIASANPLVVAVAPFRQIAKGRLLMAQDYTWVPARLPRWTASHR